MTCTVLFIVGPPPPPPPPPPTHTHTHTHTHTGVSEPERLSDKHHYYGHRNVASTEQVSLFSQTPDSFLYQEMLTFKASATRSKEVSFDSDWDVTSGGDHYDGGSERSLSSDPFYSDNEESFSSLLAKKGSNGSNSFSKDFSPSQPSEYHTPSHFSKSLEDKDTPLIKRSNKMPQFHPLPHIVAKVKVLQRRANSLEDLSSPIYQSDEGKMYLTPGNEDSSSDVVEADYHHQKLTGDLLKLDRKLVQFSTPSGVSSSSLEDLTAVPSMFKRGVSLLRGEKTEKIISPLLRTSTVSNASTSNSQYVSSGWVQVGGPILFPPFFLFFFLSLLIFSPPSHPVDWSCRYKTWFRRLWMVKDCHGQSQPI